MDINKWIINSSRGGTGLGESTPDIMESLKSPNFNNYSYAVTITIKGHAQRALADNLQQQYDLFKKIIKQYIHEECNQYYFAFELHKCGSYIHAHGIFNPKLKKSVQKIKQQVYLAIERQPIKKGMSYKTRILIEKVFQVDTWIPYITKDAELMDKTYPFIKPIYKLDKQKASNHLVTFDL